MFLQKIFLDTTRLLATKTDNLVDELWKYMEDGKLIQSAVLLLAAQEQIRGECSSKIKGNVKQDGFSILMHRIFRSSIALRWEKSQKGNSRKQLEEKRALVDCTALLIDIISQAGEVLSAYIQAHSEVCLSYRVAFAVPLVSTFHQVLKQGKYFFLDYTYKMENTNKTSNYLLCFRKYILQKLG